MVKGVTSWGRSQVAREAVAAKAWAGRFWRPPPTKEPGGAQALRLLPKFTERVDCYVGDYDVQLPMAESEAKTRLQ